MVDDANRTTLADRLELVKTACGRLAAFSCLIAKHFVCIKLNVMFRCFPRRPTTGAAGGSQMCTNLTKRQAETKAKQFANEAETALILADDARRAGRVDAERQYRAIAADKAATATHYAQMAVVL